MPNYRAQVILPTFSLLPTDVVTNTFHFFTLTPTSIQDVASDVTPEIAEFYETVYATGHVMADYMRPNIATVRWYDLDTPQPRVPLIVNLGATIATATSQIPAEVAAVLSFQGPPIAGVPQARRRGRLYFGGLVGQWISNSTANNQPFLAPSGINALTSAAIAFRDSVLLGVARWAVWSPTDSAMVQITNGWVDNAPDTQRRRGFETTSRALWS